MAIWRIINRSYIKHASSRFTRSYNQVSLASSFNYAPNQSKICTSNNPNSDICRKPWGVIENVRFLASSAQARMKDDIETDGPRLNEQITAQFIRLVSEDGHCIMPRNDALRLAREKQHDLVEVHGSGNPPVCKIMDYTREKYLKATREKERAKAKRAETTLRPDVKEVHFTPKIESKDLKLKADQALRMMERGYRVKCVAVSDKNREIEPEKLVELLSRFAPFIEDTIVENGPSLEKKQAFVVVRHVKFGAPKKGGLRKLKDVDIKNTVKIPSRNEDSTKDESVEAGEKDSMDVDGNDFVERSEKPLVNSSRLTENTKPGFDVNQNQPVESNNRYANREPSNQISARHPPDNRGQDSRDTNRYGPKSPNPQHSQPQSDGLNTNRYGPRSPNPPHSQPRSDGTDYNRYGPRSPNPQHSQSRSDGIDTNRYGPPKPQHSQPRSDGIDTNRYGPLKPQHSQPRSDGIYTNRYGPRSPNQPQNPQHSQPQFPNQAPNQNPTGFQIRSPKPEHSRGRVPNQEPKQQPTGSASSFGIFSNPKTNQD